MLNFHYLYRKYQIVAPFKNNLFEIFKAMFKNQKNNIHPSKFEPPPLLQKPDAPSTRPTDRLSVC